MVPMPQAGSTRIVFTSNRDGQAQLYSMDANGGNLIRLTNNGSNDDHPRWSPNGTRILFQSDRDNPATGTYDVYVMNVDGTGQTRLTTDVADDCNAVWSADGNKVAFQSLRNGSYYQVYAMNADGTSQSNISNGAAADYQPSWSPDGSKIAFASERDHAGAPSVYVMNTNGFSQTRLTFSSEIVRDEQPAWSRDATKIAFVSTRDGNKEIYLMNANGSSQVRLTNTLENDDSPYWSPDSTQIVFRSERERNSYDPIQQLWVMSADGSNQTLLAGNGFGDYSPSWSTGTTGNQPPVASAGGPYSGVVAQNVPFSGGGSFDPDGSINSYSWSFGDGGTGSGISLTHTYAATGTYPVTLMVTDNLGAQTSATTTTSITAAASEQYLANFNQSAVARAPYTNESSYWNDILRAAYPNGQSSMLLAVRELGKTLFESSEYAARNRDNHWYVYDLYKTYLMREPDASGWAFWEGVCNSNGRENVRRAFDECGEFAGVVSTLTPNGAPSSTVSSLASARVDPFNQPGNGLAARDAEWSVSLLSLPGRAGLDLGLSLSYSSMIWTRSGPYIYFDEDNGWPGPGFRLGFPTIQEKSFDAQAGRNVYLLISGGSRVSLRQLGSSSVYEAADSSYLQLIDNGGSLLVRTTDGTQLSYQSYNNEWRCSQIKDHNGNYITVNYDWLGHITTIIDTLARSITFNYDTNANLTSITQSWTVNGGAQTHTWASFGWATKTMQPSFSGVMVVGAANGYTFPVISQVGLDDGSRYTFEYNSSGQVNPIRSYRSDSVQRAYTAYDYDSPADDCPRLIDTHTWADNWTGINGVPQEVATLYSAPNDGSHTATTPDGSLYKEFYGNGWQRGLTTRTEVWSAGVRQKWTTNEWAQDQDSTGINYQTNPRVTETNVFDASGNRRRTTVSYAPPFALPSGASCSLPRDTREYAGDATTILRRTHVDYRMDAVADASYLSRHILGLVKEQTLYEVSGGTETLMSKVGFGYDEANSVQGSDASVNHDSSYDANFVSGRANLSSVKRYDVTDTSVFTVASSKYNTAGGIVDATDPLSHHTIVSYADSFSDGNNGRNTLAYPKVVTDAEGYSSTVIYNFDFGAVTSKQTPQPNSIENLPGPVQTFAYDAAGRIERVTATTNNSYTRYIYGPNYVQSFGTVNSVADEAYSIQLFDGMGRTVVAARNHPASTGGYSAVNTIYDAMGRAIKSSNPTETSSGWEPAGDDAQGWLYSQLTYDWKGRPLVTTNTDLTTKEVSYSGCGCAGGEVVTLTDEGTINGGVPKRRQQKIYSDVLGRSVKTEILNWEGSGPAGVGRSVYSTTINTYNARDQITRVRQFDTAQGTVPADPNDLSCPTGSCQQTTLTYDGFGRPKTKHIPEQDEATAATWNYNADDSVQSASDARGASATFSYNPRGLVTHIAYEPSAGTPDTPDVSLDYDAAGNRKSMSDGLGSVTYVYDQLSRMTSEIRVFSDLGTYPLNYAYNFANQLTSITDPFSAQVGYTRDVAGRVSAVTSSGFGNVSTYASNFQYRAWGALKHLNYSSGSVLNATYDARLQTLSFSAAGAISMTYQHFADGRVSYSHDAIDQRFDRSYSYDQSGELTQALSGAEARGEPATNDRPYNQDFTFDVWGNMTGRSGKHWSKNFPVFGGTYANNRLDGWQYDADGRNLISNSVTSTFDAAGRLVQTSSPRRRTNPALVMTQQFDGDGHRTKKTENSETMYLLRSSVLGGAVIDEIYGTANQFFGQKQRGHVYANGSELAQQNAFLGEAVNAPTDPSGMERIGSLGGQLDPLGDDVGQEDPYLPDRGADPGFNYPHMGDMSDPSSGCTVDGQPWNCTQLFKVFNAHIVSRVERGPFSGQGSGFDPWLNGSLKWIDDWRPKHVDHPADDPGEAVLRVYTDIYNGHWEWFPADDQQHFAHAPQNPGPEKTVPDPQGKYHPPLWCQPDVIKAMQGAWARTANGTSGNEAGFVLNGTPSKYKIVETKSGNTKDYQSFTINTSGPDQTFLLFHVHPNRSTRNPSTPGNNALGNKTGDTGVADAYNLLFLVGHRTGLTLYDPKVGKPVDLRDNLDWLKACK